MRYDDLVRRVHALPVIDSQTLWALGENRRSLGVQLSRWVAAGKLVQLRRGLYQLPPHLRTVDPSPLFLANLLHAPSYVSLESALSFHGLIPERVPLTQSVTAGRPARFETPVGAFEYRHVKRDWFFGYRETPIPGGTAIVAEPEKAVLDLVHLSRGEFPTERIRELRLAGVDRLSVDRITRFARMAAPRVQRAASELQRLISSETGVEVR